MQGKTNCSTVNTHVIIKSPYMCYYNAGGRNHSVTINNLIPGKKYLVGVVANYGNIYIPTWNITGGTVNTFYNSPTMGKHSLVIPDSDTITLTADVQNGGNDWRVRVIGVDDDFEGTMITQIDENNQNTVTITSATKKVYVWGSRDSMSCRPVPDSGYDFNNYNVKSNVAVETAVGVVQFIFPTETFKIKGGAVGPLNHNILNFLK